MEVDLSSLIFFILLLMLCSATVFILYWCWYRPYQLNKRYGIPGPTPLPVLGNYLLANRMGVVNLASYGLDQYGPVSMMYFGFHPWLLLGDIDILESVLLENLSNVFTNREMVPDFFTSTVGLPPGLFMAKGAEWKQSRMALSPAFSSRNMRMVANNLKATCERLPECLRVYADSGKSIVVNKLFAEFAMEGTVSMVIGEVPERYSQTKQVFVTSADKLLSMVDENSITLLMLITSVFPWTVPVLGPFLKIFKGRQFTQLSQACTKLVLNHTGNKNKTILQLLLDAKTDDGGTTRSLTTKEIVTQLITFLLAGIETTSATLCFTAYQLALNPHVQERLHNEIEEYFKSKPSASSLEAAQELKYMDLVLQESMRMFPPVPLLVRKCSETIHINGVTIPEGVSIYVPVRQIQNDPQHWPNPEQFIPERFLPAEKASRRNVLYMPFGVGARNCIGARFASLEVKMMLIQVLKTLRFVRTPETLDPKDVIYKLTGGPSNTIFLKVTSW